MDLTEEAGQAGETTRRREIARVPLELNMTVHIEHIAPTWDVVIEADSFSYGFATGNSVPCNRQLALGRGTRTGVDVGDKESLDSFTEAKDFVATCGTHAWETSIANFGRFVKKVVV